jgi:hypothetical protein
MPCIAARHPKTINPRKPDPHGIHEGP